MAQKRCKAPYAVGTGIRCALPSQSAAKNPASDRRFFSLEFRKQPALSNNTEQQFSKANSCFLWCISCTQLHLCSRTTFIVPSKYINTGCMTVSAFYNRLHVYPLFAPVACYPGLDVHTLHVFPRLTPIACFPAHRTSCLLSRA